MSLNRITNPFSCLFLQLLQEFPSKAYQPQSSRAVGRRLRTAERRPLWSEGLCEPRRQQAASTPAGRLPGPHGRLKSPSRGRWSGAGPAGGAL